MIQFLGLDNVTILGNVKAGQVDGIIPTIPADISPIDWPASTEQNKISFT